MAICRALAGSATDWNESPGDGRCLEAEHFDRRRRAGHLQRAAAVVDERAHAADDRTGDDVVADAQRAVLHQHGGDRTAAAIELGFEHRAERRALRVGLVLADFRDEQNHFEQQVEPGLLLGRDLDEDRRAAPVFGHQIEVGELALDGLRIGARLVDLVDRDDDRHVRRARVIDRLLGLRHHAVVGRDDEHDDVGDARSAGAHQRERFVAGRVEEDDVLVASSRRPARDTRRCAA